MERDIDGLRTLVAEMQVLQDKTKYNKLGTYKPYKKQKEFHDYGLIKKERMLRAGNQNGKTFAGAMECAYHLTGEYPAWWNGRRYDRPIKCWVGCNTGINVRDGAQKLLFGEPGVEAMVGTGTVPRANILDVSLARGVDALYDTVQVKHKSGSISICRFKTYDQGRLKWQGETLDFIWFDEEPPMDVYSEGLTRTMVLRGFVFLTFTPLLGMSDVVIHYMNEPSPDRVDINMTIEDALHIPKDERARIIAAWPSHEREARKTGAPMLGSGKIFTTPEETLRIPRQLPLPLHWFYLWGIDFGGASDIAHPFAAVLLGWDKDADCINVCHGLRLKDMRPLDHAEAMKPFGKIPVAWPHDGTAKESNGVQLKNQYAKYLPMLGSHATFSKGGYSTEVGVIDMQTRMSTGKWRVFDSCVEWFEEYRNYHRKDGLIVKVRDDLLSASRIGMMMIRYAKLLPSAYSVQLGSTNSNRYDTEFPL